MPYTFKPAGYLFILPGLFLLTIRFYYDIKLDLFNIKTFAIYSTYLETKYFSIIDNHFTEEIGGFLLILGLSFIILSKEKYEKHTINELRLKAFILSFYINFVFQIVIVLFVFGIAFIKLILVGLLLPFLTYYFIFKYFLFKNRNYFVSNKNED
ncbi:MAG: hypothetical protein IPJ23_01460 [Ignavibacteriales bacterium]|nr:hypothetical protein [Ignavibacteriales bacterium]